MTHTDRSAPNPASLRQARIQRVLDGVVASYIHEISARTGSVGLRELRTRPGTSPAPAS
jgi:hypothetical protein